MLRGRDRWWPKPPSVIHEGRSGIYDVRVTAGDGVVAEFRGQSRTTGDSDTGCPMLPDLSPRPGDLDPIETASRDELAALQRAPYGGRRCAHAYANVPHYTPGVRRGRACIPTISAGSTT